MAALLNALDPQDGKPATIVIDKYFSGGSCLSSQEENRESELLTEAVQSAAKHIPVIVGEATDTAKQKAEDSCLVYRSDSMLFAPLGRVHRGLTKLNANHEQIPLRWRVLDAQPPPLEPRHGWRRFVPRTKLFAPYEDRDSLVLSAATILLQAGKVPGQASLPQLTDGERQPYAYLRPANSLPEISSEELVCIPGKNCPPREEGSSDPQARPNRVDLKNRVVLIGARGGRDSWSVLGESHWGYELQAEYLDALLTGQYLRAIAGRAIIALWFGFLLLLEGVPVLSQYLHFEHGAAAPDWLQHSQRWTWIFGPVFFILVLACSYLVHAMPPLLLLFGVLVALLTRDFINRREHYKHKIIPHEKD